MNDKDRKRHFAYEALVLLGMLALLLFICRLWPVLLLVILGIFAAVIRLLFLSSKKVETLEPQPLMQEPVRPPDEKDVQALAYSVILRRITELVEAEYPQARWVWESPSAARQIQESQETFILLNKAGGYRRARVRIQNLQVVGLVYLSCPDDLPEEEEPEDSSGETQEEAAAQNYELLAFEWTEAHIFELNARCNEAIGEKLTELVLLAEELPVRESWGDICRELARAGLSEVQCVPEGIKINLMQ